MLCKNCSKEEGNPKNTLPQLQDLASHNNESTPESFRKPCLQPDGDSFGAAHEQGQPYPSYQHPHSCHNSWRHFQVVTLEMHCSCCSSLMAAALGVPCQLSTHCIAVAVKAVAQFQVWRGTAPAPRPGCVHSRHPGQRQQAAPFYSTTTSQAFKVMPPAGWPSPISQPNHQYLGCCML
jgi:hypothetical protein